MKQVSVAQAKARLSELLNEAAAGDEVVITRRGVPVGCLSGVAKPKRPLRLDDVDAFRASVSPAEESSEDLVRRMRDASY
jgi:prevent-host-death family protein